MTACKCTDVDCQNATSNISESDCYLYEDVHLIMDDDIDYVDEEIVD